MHDTLLNIFIFVDDFCQTFEKHWNKLLIDVKGKNSRNRKPELFLSEIMTIHYAFILGILKVLKLIINF